MAFTAIDLIPVWTHFLSPPPLIIFLQIILLLLFYLIRIMALQLISLTHCYFFPIIMSPTLDLLALLTLLALLALLVASLRFLKMTLLSLNGVRGSS